MSNIIDDDYFDNWFAQLPDEMKEFIVVSYPDIIDNFNRIHRRPTKIDLSEIIYLGKSLGLSLEEMDKVLEFKRKRGQL